jgi:CheY-like chemotaxis protein
LLVVEDSPAYLYLIQKAFSKRVGQTRWELKVAKDGGEAVHMLFDEEGGIAPLPDLILLDWNLPNISGAEVLRRVKRHQELLKIPILVFSSSDSAADIHSAYAGHANGYITKPGDNDALGIIVESIELVLDQLPETVLSSGPGAEQDVSR